MIFTPAHVKVIHNVACNLHVHRAAVSKQAETLVAQARGKIDQMALLIFSIPE
jgi:hypothetical protein